MKMAFVYNQQYMRGADVTSTTVFELGEPLCEGDELRDVVTGEAYTVCPPNHTLVVSDFMVFEKCVYSGAGSGPMSFDNGSGAGGGPKYASASLVALAVAAAAAVKMC